jgi:hypothetical protein
MVKGLRKKAKENRKIYNRRIPRFIHPKPKIEMEICTIMEV